jgi:hypothetical protein
MNSASKHAVTALLVLFMAGCAPKNTNTAAPPPQAQAPDISAGKAGAMYPPPLTQSQTQTEPAQPEPAPVIAQTDPTPAPPPPPPATTKKTAHKVKPSTAKPAAGDTASTPASAGSETPTPATASPASTGTTDIAAANSELEASSPIGQLAPADTPEAVQKGKDTGDLIVKTEDGLSSIKRPLSTQEQETANQIKAFLNKAKTALTNQDFDGAYILATKAKVLLDELNKT